MTLLWMYWVIGGCIDGVNVNHYYFEEPSTID